MVDVPLGTQETSLLGSPPGEANSVVDLKFSQVKGNFKDGDSSRAVVVDAGASGNGIGVAANVDDVLLVTSLGLDNDVLAFDDACIGSQVDLDRSTRLKLSDQCLAIALRNTTRGHVRLGRVLKLLQRVALEGAGRVVVGNDADSAVRGGKAYFDAEFAGSPENDGDLVCEVEASVVGLLLHR